MSFHKIAPVGKAREYAPAPKREARKPAPKKAPRRRPVGGHRG
ncbi:hypothetical protein ABTX35_03715 [Streptomyces sp. NPDC096080]